jgi:hypothetical protein
MARARGTVDQTRERNREPHIDGRKKKIRR